MKNETTQNEQTSQREELQARDASQHQKHADCASTRRRASLEEAREEIRRYQLLLDEDLSNDERLNLNFYLRFAQLEYNKLLEEAIARSQ